MCTVVRVFPVIGSLTCNNAGANTHAGLHSSAGMYRGRSATWLWYAPASGTHTAVNSDESPTWPRSMQVGIADI